MPWLLIALAVVARLLPHPFNLTPVGALGLYAGAACPPRLAWLVPLAAVIAGDLVTGLYEPVVAASVYLGLLCGPVAGRLLLAERRTPRRFAAAVLAGALGFFLLSNLGNWLAFFPHTFPALIECYARGLPLLGNTLAGDALFGAILFGADAAWRASRPAVTAAH